MYNEKIKREFIASRPPSVSTVKFAKIVFNHTEKYEVEWGADICTRSSEDLQRVVDTFGISSRTQNGMCALLRNYIKWCVQKGIPGAIDGMQGVEIRGIEKVKLRTVASPAHFQHVLDMYFSPESEEQVDNILRCYLWMAYEGMPEEVAIGVRKGDVDFKNMLVTRDGFEIPIRHEAIPCFRNATLLNSFVVKHPQYTTRLDRFPGDEIMRSIKSGPRISQVRSRISNAIMYAANSGRTDVRLSCHRAEMSGMFFRALERERAGLPISFMDYAKRVALHNNPGHANSKEGRWKLNDIAKKHADVCMKDYQRWKMAFQM